MATVGFTPISPNSTVESRQTTPIANHLATETKQFAPTEQPQIKMEDYKNFAKKLFNKLVDFIKNHLSNTNDTKVEYADTLDIQKTVASDKNNIENAIKNAGFTREGVENLIKKSQTFGNAIVEDAVAIAQKLNETKDEIGYISYNRLMKTIEQVRPDAFGSTKQVLSDVIMQGWKGGEEIQNDYYSQLPEGLAANMRNLNKAISTK